MPDLTSENLQVTPAAGLPANVSPQELGADMGGAMETGAEIQQKIYRDAKDAADQAATMQAHNQLMSWEQATLHDPKNGVLYQSSGLKAPEVVDKTMGTYDTVASKIAENLTPDQQDAFDRVVQNHRFTVQEQLDRYEHGQVTDAHNDIASQSVSLNHTAAVQQSGNPLGVEQHIAQARAAIADGGKWNQLTPEAIALQQDRETASIHFDVLKQLVTEGKDQQAQIWYDANKAKLGDNLTAATALVDKGSTDGAAQRYVDSNILGKDGQYISQDDALKLTTSDPTLLANPKLRTAVEERFDHQFRAQEQATIQYQRSTLDPLLKQVSSNPAMIDDPSVQSKMLDLTFEQQNLVKSAAQREVPDIDAGRKYAIMRDLSDADPAVRAKAAEMDLTPFGSPMGKNFQELEKTQFEVRQRGAMKDEPAFTSRNQQIDNSLQAPSVGISTAKDANGNYSADYLAFHAAIDKIEDGYEVDHPGKKMPYGDRQAAIDQLLIKNVTPSDRSLWNPLTWFDGPDQSSFKFQDAKVQNEVHSSAQIPTDITNRYQQEFQRAGVTPTSGQMADLYNAEQAGVPRAPAEVSPEDMDSFTRVLKVGRADPNYQSTRDKVKRWSTGQDDAGFFDPNLIMRARAINAAMGIKP